uniref:Uncharacterized protein n=1 Tax=viral metagenome TaxID=1070528 RepID=A0A6C0BZN5_9ZZZZ
MNQRGITHHQQMQNMFTNANGYVERHKHRQEQVQKQKAFQMQRQKVMGMQRQKAMGMQRQKAVVGAAAVGEWRRRETMRVQKETEDGRKLPYRQSRGGISMSEEYKKTEYYINSKIYKAEIPKYKVCFITSIFADSYKDIDHVGFFNKNNNYDYYLFTNLDKNLFKTTWDVINVEDKFLKNLKNNIYKSRFIKFMGWDYIKTVLNKEYDAIFYCDGHLYPKDYIKWDILVDNMSTSDSEIMQSLHPYRKNSVYEECKCIVQSKKDSKKNMDSMISYLKKNNTPHNISMYENTVFCYNPNNVKLQEALKDFWNIYSTTCLTHRDQPLWAYICWKHNINPIIFNNINIRHTIHDILYNKTRQGFNNHSYV